MKKSPAGLVGSLGVSIGAYAYSGEVNVITIIGALTSLILSIPYALNMYADYRLKMEDVERKDLENKSMNKKQEQ